MNPYAQIGSARTQWAEQQVKAGKAYLQKMTSIKKCDAEVIYPGRRRAD